MPELLEYLDERGRSPFRRWFDRLNREAAAEVGLALVRLSRGYRSKQKFLGAGIFEYKIDFGSGYRIYFGRDGDELIILLGGGTKKRQSGDILKARARWKDYKRRKQRSDLTWH
ncbi:MAG: type II toxin-antitoxin system RelE/ParE family toxin [Gammaproteobacteria bacterium]|jgi:putative addiction module killer protein|nr:addiction module protein [Chromatiales bacterium]MDP6674209.1 type II toxin-antitoxin system RelE/ParE family toxin [Gammaproteobacteria bacterium]